MSTRLVRVCIPKLLNSDHAFGRPNRRRQIGLRLSGAQHSEPWVSFSGENEMDLDLSQELRHTTPAAPLSGHPTELLATQGSPAVADSTLGLAPTALQAVSRLNVRGKSQLPRQRCRNSAESGALREGVASQRSRPAEPPWGGYLICHL
jgi:hypothetical protein